MNEIGNQNRRSILKAAGAAGLMMAGGVHAHAATATARRRYAVVGVGSRSRMYLDAATG